MRRNLSAGRVQSVAVRWVVEREQDIQAFQAEEYWSIQGQAHGPLPAPFEVKLVRIGDARAVLSNEAAALTTKAAIESGPLRVREVKRKQVARRPVAPFTTSSLQQEAAGRFRFSAKHTMGIARRLYEGIEVGDGESEGLIAYIRPDWTRLSEDAVRDLPSAITPRGTSPWRNPGLPASTAYQNQKVQRSGALGVIVCPSCGHKGAASPDA